MHVLRSTSLLQVRLSRRLTSASEGFHEDPWTRWRAWRQTAVCTSWHTCRICGKLQARVAPHHHRRVSHARTHARTLQPTRFATTAIAVSSRRDCSRKPCSLHADARTVKHSVESEVL